MANRPYLYAKTCQSHTRSTICSVEQTYMAKMHCAFGPSGGKGLSLQTSNGRIYLSMGDRGYV